MIWAETRSQGGRLMARGITDNLRPLETRLSHKRDVWHWSNAAGLAGGHTRGRVGPFQHAAWFIYTVTRLLKPPHRSLHAWQKPQHALYSLSLQDCMFCAVTTSQHNREGFTTKTGRLNTVWFPPPPFLNCTWQKLKIVSLISCTYRLAVQMMQSLWLSRAQSSESYWCEWSSVCWTLCAGTTI